MKYPHFIIWVGVDFEGAWFKVFEEILIAEGGDIKIRIRRSLGVSLKFNPVFEFDFPTVIIDWDARFA